MRSSTPDVLPLALSWVTDCGKNGKGCDQDSPALLWVLLGALSSVLVEIQFPSILLRGQKAPLQGICENPFSS